MRPANTQMSSSCVGCAFASRSCRSDYEIKQILHPRVSNNRSSPWPHGYGSKHHESGASLTVSKSGTNYAQLWSDMQQPVEGCTCISARLKLGVWNVLLNTYRMQHTSGMHFSCSSLSRKLLTHRLERPARWNFTHAYHCQPPCNWTKAAFHRDRSSKPTGEIVINHTQERSDL